MMGGSDDTGPSKASVATSYLTPRFGAYIGLSSIMVFAVCWIICALMDEDWVLFEDNACVLGVSEIVSVRILYLISCTVTGLGLMLFGYVTSKSCDRRLQTVGYFFAVIFGIALIGIGVVNMDISDDGHMYFVYLMGLSAGVVMLLITVDDLIHRRWAISAFVVFTAIGFTYFSLFDEGYVQPFTITCLFIWLAVKCLQMIRTDAVC